MDKLKEYSAYILTVLNIAWGIYFYQKNKDQEDLRQLIVAVTTMTEQIKYLQQHTVNYTNESKEMQQQLIVITTGFNDFRQAQNKEDQRQNEELLRLSAGIAIIRENQNQQKQKSYHE